MDDGVELALLEPGEERRRRHHVGELALGEIAPFVACAQLIADGNIGTPSLVEARHHIRSDEPGSASDQQHSRSAGVVPSLCPRAIGGATCASSAGLVPKVCGQTLGTWWHTRA